MNFEEALSIVCKNNNLDSHIKEIHYKKDAYTYAEKIATLYGGTPLKVKNSYLYLNGVDFCFYNYKNEVNFAICGNIRAKDKEDIANAINIALKVCKETEELLNN